MDNRKAVNEKILKILEPLNTKRPLEIEYSLHEYKKILLEEYEFIYKMSDFLILQSLFLFSNQVLSPWLQSLLNNSEFQKKWREYFLYDRRSSRFTSNTSYLYDNGMKFIENNCPHLIPEKRNLDTLFDCLEHINKEFNSSGTVANLDKLKLKEDLITFIGKMAWFSLNNAHFVVLDPEFRQFYPNMDTHISNNRLSNAPLEDVIVVFKEVLSDVYRYQADLTYRNIVNEGQLEGWTITSKKGWELLGHGQGYVDKSAVTEFKEHFKKWAGPASILYEFFTLGMAGGTYKFLMGRYFRPKLNAHIETTISNRMKIIENLTNEEALDKLRIKNSKLNNIVKWTRPFCASFYLFVLWQMLNNIPRLKDKYQNEEIDSQYILLLIYNVVLFLYICYNITEILYKGWSDYMLESDLKKYQNHFNNALKKVRASDVEFYQEETGKKSILSIPIQSVGTLSLADVNIIVQSHLKSHGHIVHSSSLFGPHKRRIAITTINKNDNFASLRSDIERTCELKKLKKIMLNQLMALQGKTQLTGQIGKILVSGDRLFGEIKFSFMSDSMTSQWETFFYKHLPIEEMLRQGNQLQLKLKLLKEESFCSCLASVDKFTKEIREKGHKNKNLLPRLSVFSNTENAEKMGKPSDMQTQVEEANALAKLNKERRRRREAVDRKRIEEAKKQAEVARQRPRPN